MSWQGRWWYGVLLGGWLLGLAGCVDNPGEEQPTVPANPEPTMMELGLRLAPQGLNLTGLSSVEMTQIARGSYLVNGASGGCGCHTTAAGYLAGGLEFPLPFADLQGFTSVVSRNLTPDPETGMDLTQDAFIETMRTGKDFHNSTATAPRQLLVMPWPVYRFMALEDLKAIYVFLQHIPPVRHAVRETFQLPFPLPPVPPPLLGDGDPTNDPDNTDRGLRIPQFFAHGVAADAFNARFRTAVARLTPEQQAQVGRGSYVVNAIAACSSCHTDGSGAGMFDGGFLPGTIEVNTATYLAGGVDIGTPAGRGRLLSRNLTPDPGTGLVLTAEQFIQTMRFGADFRRPGGSLRVEPHFPADFRLTLDDLTSIYAYLLAISPVVKVVDILP